MNELFGLPAHPLFVHVPIVMLPLLAAGASAMAIRPEWRQRFTWALVGSTLATVVVTFMATRSGKPFREALQPALGAQADRHADLGNQTALLATIFFAGTVCLAVIDRWYMPRSSTPDSGSPAPRVETSAVALAALTALVGVAAAVWVVRTGHEGARLAWSGVEVGS